MFNIMCIVDSNSFMVYSIAIVVAALCSVAVLWISLYLRYAYKDYKQVINEVSFFNTRKGLFIALIITFIIAATILFIKFYYNLSPASFMI